MKTSITMHETVIVNKIIEEAKKLGNIKEITVEVGELCGITPEEVEETLKKMTDWKVKTNFKESRIKCQCGYEGTAKIIEKGHGYCLFNCPKCGKKPEVIEGGEIKIKSVEN